MTNIQLNSKIKKLGSDYWDLTFLSRAESAYYDTHLALYSRFKDLVSTYSDCIGLNESSLLIMIYLNQVFTAHYGFHSDFGQFVNLRRLV